jgi:alkylation response protein AidB-like acyl-CoA dehydrogenase
MDRFLRPEVVKMRKATRECMERNYEKLNQNNIKAEFPFWIIPELKPIGFAGLDIKSHGGAGLSYTEIGAIAVELAKLDASVATFVLVHGSIGCSVIAALGDED